MLMLMRFVGSSLVVMVDVVADADVDAAVVGIPCGVLTALGGEAGNGRYPEAVFEQDPFSP